MTIKQTIKKSFKVALQSCAKRLVEYDPSFLLKNPKKPSVFQHKTPSWSFVREFQFDDRPFSVSITNEMELKRWKSMVSRQKEPETINLVIKNIQSSSVFFDIGANIGNYTILAELMHPGCKVFSFEPEPNSYRQLCQNISLNLFEATPYCLALNSKDELGSFYVNRQSDAGLSNHQFNRQVNNRNEKFKPAAKIGMIGLRLDTLIHQYGLPVPNHIKIDVDGIELDVLYGMSETLKSPMVKNVLVEVSGGDNIQTTVSYLSSSGLKHFNTILVSPDVFNLEFNRQ